MTSRRTVGVAEIAGLGWALGLALFTATYFALYLLGVPTGAATLPALVVALGAVVAGASRLRATRRQDGIQADGNGARWERGHLARSLCGRDARAPRTTGHERSRAARLLVIGGLGVAVLQVALSAWLAARSPLANWDAWSFWALKARMFALGGPRPGYFHDPLTLFTHPDYPLNLPLAEAAVFRLPGPWGLQLAALLGPACLAALLVLFYAGLNRLYGRTVAALATGTLACIPALVAQAAGGDADIPLALYLGAASLYLLLWWRFRQSVDAVLMSLLAGGAIWTKKEGLAAAAVLLLVLLAGEALRRPAPPRARLWPSFGALGAALLIPLPWLLFTRLVYPSGRDFLPLTLATFVAHADRLPYIATSFALQMLDFANWSLLWVALVALLFLVARRLTPCGRALLLVLLGQLGVYALAFVFSDWQPYTAHVQTSLDRLLAQAIPLAFLLLVEAVQALRTPAAAGTGTTEARTAEDAA